MNRARLRIARPPQPAGSASAFPAWAVIAALAWCGASAALAQSPTRPAHDSSLPIEITADSLEVRQDRRVAVFRGSVLAVQGEMRLRADEVVVHYRDGVGGKGAEAGSISRIDADGGVLFSSPAETAEGKHGVYDVDHSTITLTGSVVLARGDNVIRGEYVVLNLATGQSRIEAGPPGAGTRPRVKSIFVPKGKQIQ